MCPEHARPPEHPGRPGLVLPVPIDPSGRDGPTRGQARGPSWRRTSHGLYVRSDVDAADPQQRVLEASAVLPDGGGVTGWGALCWSGGRWFDGTTAGGRVLRPVWLASAAGDVREQRGIRVCAERLSPAELMVLDGVWVTCPERSVLFEMRYAATERQAVVHADMAAYSDLVSLAELGQYLGTRNASTGLPKARRALPQADENSWSPMEVLMRLVWTLDAGLPRPLTNRPVFDLRGRHLGTPDLIDPVAGIVGEYDGAHHLEGAQRHHDVQRESAFRTVGLEYVTMLAADHRDPHGFIRRLHATYRRAAYAAPGDRRWTLELPSGWLDLSTVEARRKLDARQRDRLLRGRRR
jgi:hypothetical protein